MIDRLIEGKLVTLLVGSVFRIVEIFVRAIHLAVRGARLLVQEVLTSRIDSWISRFVKRVVANRTQVDDSSIVLITSDGEYTGDPKYIAEEILRRGTHYRMTWVLHERSIGPYPRAFHFVRYGTADFFRSVARAKVVIQDGHVLQESGASKAPAQHWLQTGHGMADGLIAAKQTRAPKPMLGHARNDLLLDTSQETANAVRKKVLDRLEVADTGQRFLLYAPAPGAGRMSATPSGIDFSAVRAALSTKFGGTWDVLIRSESSSHEQKDRVVAGLPASCHNASFYPDLQELLVLADAGMTDHSRWIGDYMLTRKPIFLFSTQPGGVCHDFEGAPFTIATSNRELFENIEQFDPKIYDDKVEQFLSMWGHTDDGKAASRIVDEIEDLMA